MLSDVSTSKGSIGLVLSGGGARGAYEVGALTHIAEQLPGLLARIRVITGTSVGAVNGAFLACRGVTPDAVRELAHIWSGLAMDDLVRIDRSGVRELLAAGGKRLIGRPAKSPAIGVLDVSGISKLVQERADWRALRRVVRSGRLDGVGFAATDIATGRTRLFVDHARHVVPRWPRGDDAAEPEPVVFAPSHILASAAIPLLFPPVRVGTRWYVDGGVRYNTPLAPALGLGAESLLIVSVRTAAEGRRAAQTDDFPGFGQVVGKVLDSVFLDRVAFDLDRLTRINDVVDAVESLGGDLLDQVRAELRRRDRPAYRTVRYAHVRPSFDLGALASEHLERAAKTAGRFSFARVLSALFQDDAGTSGDAASFLLFDAGYAKTLMDVGRRDAEAAHDELARL
jgi:NTE family protein